MSPRESSSFVKEEKKADLRPWSDGMSALLPGRFLSLFELIRLQRWDDALDRLDSDRGKEEAAQCHPKDDDSPLHHACYHGAPVKVVERLCEAFPRGVAKFDKYRRLPLHVACGWSSVDVIRTLLDVFPQGAAVRNVQGWLALHVAVSSSTASKDVVRALLNVYRDGARKPDLGDWLPIHIACWRGASLGVIQMLLDACPEGVYQRNDFDELPIELAIRYSRAPSGVVDALAEGLTKMHGSRVSTWNSDDSAASSISLEPVHPPENKGYSCIDDARTRIPPCISFSTSSP